MARRQTYLTPEGRRNLEEELDLLKNVRRREMAARIHRASETGGTVDNAEYDEAKNQQAFVEGRISDLENILSNVLDAPVEDGNGAVKFGSTVTVTVEKGTRRLYTVVGSAETNPLKGRISMESPVGRALLGRKVGDKVDVQTPSGTVQLTILKVG